MPHKDPAARAAYWTRFYADPKNKKKNRAKVKRWRKRNPTKHRKQARRNRASAREREALRTVESLRGSLEATRQACICSHSQRIEQEKHQGYGGKINVERI